MKPQYRIKRSNGTKISSHLTFHPAVRHVLLVLFWFCASFSFFFFFHFILDASVAVCTFAFVLCNRIWLCVCLKDFNRKQKNTKCVFMCDGVCECARSYCNIHVLKMLFNFVSWRLTMIINYFIAPGEHWKNIVCYLPKTTLVVALDQFGNGLCVLNFDWQNVSLTCALNSLLSFMLWFLLVKLFNEIQTATKNNTLRKR